MFHGTPNWIVVCWTAMISGLAINGCGRVVEDGDVTPDGVLFLSVLATCCHAGLLDEGRTLFDDLLKNLHGLAPETEH